jgi:hypothetical protein
MLLSCSVDEAQRIRDAAKRKETTISGLVMHGLGRGWILADRNLGTSDAREPAKHMRVLSAD